jgi:DNA-binding NarL/FixJ family response regulator
LLRQNEVLRSLVDDVGPSLASVSRRIHEVSRVVAEVEMSHPPRAQERASSIEPRDPTRRALLPLSRRELEVLGLLAQGLSNKEIAGVMWLSDRTVERHITSLYRKIGVARRSEATAFALRHGVV